ncbi:DNA primase [Streptomyces sp. NPDC048349]|uniref:DNA primase n=1 Tax=Streptomyces sp. NPDC048349 TaxID=3155486 RepID=UPI00342E4115
MNNRMAMGLAVSAGYVLGRTKKAKLAFGLTTLVLGRKLAPNAASVASFIGSRLGDHPQVKEIREQMRTDLRGVGSAAVSALVDRRLEAVADRLHDRTLDVQDRLTALTGKGDDKVRKTGGAGEAEGLDDEEADDGEDEGGDGTARKRPARKQAAGRTGTRRTGSTRAKSSAGASAKSSGKPPARRTAKRSAGRGQGGDGDA